MAAGLVLVPVVWLGVTQVAVAPEASASGAAPKASASGTVAPEASAWGAAPLPPGLTTVPPEPVDSLPTSPASSLSSVVAAPSSPAPIPPTSGVEPAGDGATPTDPLIRLVQLGVGGALLLGAAGVAGLYLTREHKGAER